MYSLNSLLIDWWKRSLATDNLRTPCRNRCSHSLTSLVFCQTHMSWCLSSSISQPEPESRRYELCPWLSMSGDMSGNNTSLYSLKNSLCVNNQASSAVRRHLITKHSLFIIIFYLFTVTLTHLPLIFRGRVMSVKHSKKTDMLPMCCTDCHQQTSLVMKTWAHHTSSWSTSTFFISTHFLVLRDSLINKNRVMQEQ